MGSSYFRFKQFVVHHDKATMKVGTDGVLLGAWANVDKAKQILDIGTGSGVIALMLAQRTPSSTQIDAVELELHNAGQAQENVTQSRWKEKIAVHHLPIQQYYPGKKYDLIISNPPYFVNSYRPPDEKRTQARHTVTLSFTELLAAVERLLSEDGRFSLVLPHPEGLDFIEQARKSNLHCNRKWFFRSRNEKPVERLLLEFSHHDSSVESGEIVLYSQATGEQWSEAYKALTKDFYLKI